MFLFGNKKREEIIAVIDIASASVGGMLIKKSPALDPEIITSTRIPVNFLMDVDFQAFWRCTLSSLSKVLSKLLKDYPKGPDKVLCVFSHIWIVSQTRVIKIKKEKPFEINKEFLQKIIDDEIKNLKTQIPDTIPGMKGEVEVLEQKIMRTTANGYNVKNPFDKKAKRFSFYMHICLINKNVEKTIKEIIFKNFGDINVCFRSSPFIVFNILKNIINADEDFIFIDIDGETSDIALVRKNILEEVVSMPRGRNFLLRKIASGFKTFINDAVSLLNSYQKSNLAPDVLEKLLPIIKGAKEEWYEFFEKALNEISQESPLPSKSIIVSNKRFLADFTEIIKSQSFAKFTVLAKPFNLEIISTEGLKNHFKFRRSINADDDVFLMLESLFADKFLE